MTEDKKPAYRWTPEEDEVLKRLIVTERKSFGVAARELAMIFRKSYVTFTRNACISRAHRLELDGRKKHDKKPYRREPGERSPYKQNNERAEPSISLFRIKRPCASASKPRYNPGNHAIEIVDGTCQFIEDNGKKCREPYDGKTNWCAMHRQRCYVQNQ